MFLEFQTIDKRQHKRSVKENLIVLCNSNIRIHNGKTFHIAAKNRIKVVDGVQFQETDLDMVIRLIKQKTNLAVPVDDVKACHILGKPGCGIYIISFSNRNPGSAWEALSDSLTTGKIHMLEDNIFLNFQLSKTKEDISFKVRLAKKEKKLYSYTIDQDGVIKVKKNRDDIDGEEIKTLCDLDKIIC